MKILQLILILGLTSCTSLIQVIETKTTNCKTVNDTYFFENDSVKITYNFWGNNGDMAFSIFNKTDKPLYVNWKNSSFIINGEKFDYWSESTSTQSNSVTNGYYLKPRNLPNITYNASNTQTNSITTKPEKVTFIPPKSSTSKNKFYMVSQEKFILSNNKVLLTDSSYKNDKIEFEQFSKENSPFIWRNYLAISGTEEGSSFMFIDNQFFLSSVKIMNLKCFKGKAKLDDDYNHYYILKERKMKSFYLDSKNKDYSNSKMYP